MMRGKRQKEEGNGNQESYVHPSIILYSLLFNTPVFSFLYYFFSAFILHLCPLHYYSVKPYLVSFSYILSSFALWSTQILTPLFLKFVSSIDFILILYRNKKIQNKLLTLKFAPLKLTPLQSTFILYFTSKLVVYFFVG